jgi:hypothetical protein
MPKYLVERDFSYKRTLSHLLINKVILINEILQTWETIPADFQSSLDTPTHVTNNARQVRQAGLNDTELGPSDQRRDAPALGQPPPEGRLARRTRAMKVSRFGLPQSVLLYCFIEVTVWAQDRESSRQAMMRVTSQEQEDGTISKDLTRDIALSMMWRSSARRRRGLARDVLRTSVPVAANPHRGPVGARLREPEEASRPRLPTRPALVQAFRRRCSLPLSTPFGLP